MGDKTQGTGGHIAGVDVGGTFTDLVVLDPVTGRVRIGKVPTTSDDQSRAVLQVLEETGPGAGALDLLIHGTTTTTNALLERKIARVGMITTRGFRDVIELGRRTRPHAYGLFGTFRPVVPRNLRLDVDERIEASGRIHRPLDEDAVAAVARALLADGCEAVVIHFLHAYRNPVHELRAGEIVREIWPNDFITLGHALLSEAREFERGVTASVNAGVQPVLQRYVQRLRSALRKDGYGRDFLMMNGNGGTVSSEQVVQQAAKTVMSGPASGVIAAARIAALSGHSDILTYDMGGTSSDVALIRNGRPVISNEIEIEYAMPIHVPMVDVHTVGAGGGSIAHVNNAGLLEVGPNSAGSMPGPICFGRGGTEPTITDANLLLGRLDPEKLLAVDVPVDMDELADIFLQSLGRPLGLSAADAAAAVLRVGNLKMAGAIRMVSVSRGKDPRDFVLFAFGGAGPLHAVEIARELGVPRVMIPARPGLTNAIGCMVADLQHDYVNTLNLPVGSLQAGQIDDIFAAHIAQGHGALTNEVVKPEEVRIEHSLDMQFAGQTHLIRVAITRDALDQDSLQRRFEHDYFERFRVRLPEIRAVVVNANTTVVGVRTEVALDQLIASDGRATTVEAACLGTRQVWFDGIWHATPVYARERLPLDAVVEGPALMEQFDATIVVPPGARAEGDPRGNILIQTGRAYDVED